jgi:hypothetical protein
MLARIEIENTSSGQEVLLFSIPGVREKREDM